jgi:hypothetical protein
MEACKRNIGGKRQAVTVFLDVAKAFETVLVEGLLYKLIVFNFPSHILKRIPLFV